MMCQGTINTLEMHAHRKGFGQAAAELLDMRIASLQAQVAASEASQQAPSADKAAAQPDSSPRSLTAGVTSTAAVRTAPPSQHPK